MAEGISSAVEARLEGAQVLAHLATCADGRPHAAPLWYRYAGDDVVEIVTTGQKLANIRRNPRVALSIVADEDGIPEWHATLFGTATVVEDQAETAAANRRLNRKYGVPEDAWEENQLVRIEVGSVSYDTRD